jgi:pilus assembly protein CpaB
VNPRQRRGVLLMGLAGVAALAVFVSVSSYVAEVGSQVGPMTPVVRLVTDAVPYEPVTSDMLETVFVPERWMPANALETTASADGMVTTTPLPAGTVLQEGMLVPPPQLERGQRELAILVDAETGVAGKIQPGSFVDIYATFEGDQVNAPQANVVVERALILNVGTPTMTSEQTTTGAFVEGEVVPVTFALSVDDSLRLAYIESFARHVRLALRAPDDRALVDPAQRIYQPRQPQAGGVTP